MNDIDGKPALDIPRCAIQPFCVHFVLLGIFRLWSINSSLWTYCHAVTKQLLVKRQQKSVLRKRGTRAANQDTLITIKKRLFHLPMYLLKYYEAFVYESS